jgi:ABC-type cobalamin transport system permease subunit
LFIITRSDPLPNRSQCPIDKTSLKLLELAVLQNNKPLKYAKVLTLTAALGGLLLLSADTLGRVIMAPMELPVGIVVSILGAPYFIYLLIRNV